MKNNFILDNLLLQEEGIRLEFKSRLDRESIAKDITGMINTRGGDIVIGLTKDKQIIGIDLDDELVENLRIFLMEYISPVAPISYQVLEYKGTNLILISVWEGGRKPYHYKNIIYNRQGKNTFKSSGITLDSLISDRRSSDFSWERQALLGVELDQLDLGEIRKTMKAYLEYSKSDIIVDEEDFLIDRGLIVNGNITNACMVLFGQNPSRYIPQSTIRLTVYQGNDKSGSFIDDRFFSNHLFLNINAVLEYLAVLYGKSITVDGVHRSEKHNYPIVAIREGLLNAAIHRDYNASEGFLKISIYYNKTIISNFGSLPEGMSTSDLNVEHNSILRNPDLANMCFYRKLIEMLGTGTLRMINDCKSLGFDKPHWNDANNILELTFPGIGHGKREGASEGASEGANYTFEGVSDGVVEGLNEVLNYIESHPNKKAKDISLHLKKGQSTIERYLKILKEKELVIFVGAAKTGGYQIVT